MSASRSCHGAVLASSGDLSADLVGEEDQQLVFVADVPVQDGGLDAEALRQAAHRQPVEPDLVQQREGGPDDLLAVEGPALARAAGVGVGNETHGHLLTAAMLPAGP